MRPCPTCDCFVPAAASRCPRCAAALEPIPACEEQVAEVARAERDLVLVGARSHAEPLTGSGHDPTHGRGPSVALPPLDGPTARRAPALPKLPQPFSTDPLVLAVFLGIPLEPAGPPGAPREPATPPAEAGPSGIERAVAELVAAEPVVAEPVEPEPGAPEPTAIEGGTPEAVEPQSAEPEVEAAAAPRASETFAALLGTVHHDDLLPAAPAAAPAPTVVAVPVATPVATPVVTSIAPTTAVVPATVRPVRRSRHDPFGRRTTRRERVLTRICLLLVVALAGAVVVLRLPLGARPQLSASASASGTVGAPTATTSPFADAIRLQTRADLAVVVAKARQVFPVWKSYGPVTPAVLGAALPQFGFVSGTHPSRSVGEISVAATGTGIVFAEYAGPGHCTFARAVGRRPAQAIGPLAAPCVAANLHVSGWTVLPSDG